MVRKPVRRYRDSGQQKLKFHVLGSAGAVTGSLFLFEYFDAGRVERLLLEVGLDQEEEHSNFQNRLPRGITADMIDFVVLSHAHLDHSGWFPRLVQDGFTGKAYTHEAGRDLLAIMLPDSGHLQEERARRLSKRAERDFTRKHNDTESPSAQPGKSNRRGGKQHRSEEEQPKRVSPLYTEEMARRSLSHIEGLAYHRPYQLSDAVKVVLTEADHILGAAVVNLEIGKGGKKQAFTFTGNMGNRRSPLLRPADPVTRCDWLLSEGTYGDRLHVKGDRLQALADLINLAYKRASVPHPRLGYGVIIIPAFAVDRTQSILFDLRHLITSKQIPELPVFLDSPMAIAVTDVYRKHCHLLNDDVKRLLAAGIDPFRTPRYAELRDWRDSQILDEPAKEPIIILGSSGMAEGGRIPHRLARRLPEAHCTVIFTGFQAWRTLGNQLVHGNPDQISLFGEQIRVRAAIEYFPYYSGHRDYSEIIAWFRHLQQHPKGCYLVHGDKEALASFKQHIEHKLGWNQVIIPQPGDSFDLI